MSGERNLLFPKVELTDARRRHRSGKKSHHLQSDGRIEAARIRRVLNQWFSHFPETARKEIRQRFHSKDLGNHESAFFELYLHELFIRLGFSVTPYPEIAGGAPDFLLQAKDGREFYVEAVAPIGMSYGHLQANSRRDIVGDEIAKLESPDFFLEVHTQGRLSSPYSVPELKIALRKLSAWIRTLDYDTVVAQIDQNRGPNRFRLPIDKLTLHIDPLPKRSLRGRPGVSTLGTFSYGESCDDDNFLREAILTKAKKYKKLSKPYIIAVDYLNWQLGREHILDTFLGKEETPVPENPPAGTEPVSTRPRPGIWRRDRYTRVSGVLLGIAIDPWKIADQNLALFLNPWAKHPYTGRLTELSQGVANNGTLEWKPGIHPRLVFGLPDGWPLRRPRK